MCKFLDFIDRIATVKKHKVKIRFNLNSDHWFKLDQTRIEVALY